MKNCSRCGQLKARTEFHKASEKKDGLRSRCKQCALIDAAAYRSENPDKFKKSQAAYRASHREESRARNAAWYAENRDKKLARDAVRHRENPSKKIETSAAWRAANKERCRTNLAEWHKANPEYHRIAEQNRRARKRANGGQLSPGLAEKLFKLQRGKCAGGCGKSLADGYNLDHRMPVARGGTNTDDNIQLLCPSCNRAKHAKHPVDFMQQRGFLL